MIAKYSAAIAALSTLVSAGPVVARAVAELDPTAFAEAQQRDETATRALSNAAIKTSGGKCLSVDKLSGDFRANLTPVQVVECGSTDGQGWDIITQGKHNDVEGSMLVVSTLTQACLNFDPRRPAGDQVLLFSCGGRADGGGAVTDSQLFALNRDADTQTLVPGNQKGSCLTVKGDTVDVAACDAGDAGQSFTFATDNATPAAPTSSSLATRSETCEPVTVTVTASAHVKRQDVIVTETLTEYVTVPAAAEDATSFSSTTTVFVTVGDAPSAPSAPAGGAGGAGGIPQISINPTTTVTMNPGSGGGAQPAPTSAASSAASSEASSVASSEAAPASSTKADTGAAPSAPPAGGIPQISINPTTTVTMNPGSGGGAQPAPTSAASSAASSAEAPASSAPAPSAPAKAPAPPAGGIPQISINPTSTATLDGATGAASTSAKADASPPAASAPAPPPAGGIPQISINPTTTVTLGGGAGAGGGAQPTASPKENAPAAPSAPAASSAAPPAPPAGGIPQISINPTTTVTMNPGDGAGPAQPTASAPADSSSQKEKPKAPATTAPAAAPPAGGIPQISINPSTTATL